MKKTLIIITGLLLLAFTTASIRSMYKVPREAASVCAADIDMDGDNDLFIGHLFNSQTNWTGISILINNGLEPMELDSFFLNGQHRSVIIQRLDNNSFPDLISQAWDGSNSQIGIVFNLNTSMSNIYNVDINSYADDIKTGNINNDSATDIVFISNNNQYWGILYNNDSSCFNPPQYYNLEYYPQDIVTGDLNNDGTDDIVIGGSTEIYFSKDTGFQNLQLGGHTSRVHIADIDNDGDNDIIGLFDLLGAETDITIFENTGLETFVKHDINYFLPGSTSSVVTDFNNDTLPDLMVLPASNNGAFILYNASGLEFYEPEFIEIPNDGEAYRRATTADLDGNGFNDIVLVRRTGPNAATYNNVIILFNDGEGNFVDDPLTTIQTQNLKLQIQDLICYPNPFANTTTINYRLNEQSSVVLKVFDHVGKEIKILDKSIKDKGLNKTELDMSDFALGIYFYSLFVNGQISDTKKMVIR